MRVGQHFNSVKIELGLPRASTCYFQWAFIWRHPNRSHALCEFFWLTFSPRTSPKESVNSLGQNWVHVILLSGEVSSYGAALRWNEEFRRCASKKSEM